MTTPTIHTNGTTAKELFNGYVNARHALQAALEAVQKTSPNGRDYYPQGNDAIHAAVNQHLIYTNFLEGMIADFETLEIHCES